MPTGHGVVGDRQAGRVDRGGRRPRPPGPRAAASPRRECRHAEQQGRCAERGSLDWSDIGSCGRQPTVATNGAPRLQNALRRTNEVRDDLLDCAPSSSPANTSNQRKCNLCESFTRLNTCTRVPMRQMCIAPRRDCHARMATRQRIVRIRRDYNQWVANQTMEDYALRFTAKRRAAVVGLAGGEHGAGRRSRSWRWRRSAAPSRSITASPTRSRRSPASPC